MFLIGSQGTKSWINVKKLTLFFSIKVMLQFEFLKKLPFC
jgi:hypothetical protein